MKASALSVPCCACGHEVKSKFDMLCFAVPETFPEGCHVNTIVMTSCVSCLAVCAHPVMELLACVAMMKPALPHLWSRSLHVVPIEAL